MRKIEYLSPSSLGVFEHSLTEFYFRYLAEQRPPREPQTQPMAIGSGFDARVKANIHEILFGKGTDPKYELTALYEAQVESQHRDWAWKNSEYCFEQYKQTGAFGDLLAELRKAKADPRFEFEAQGVVHGYREGLTDNIAGVTLLGKPDMHYINHDGCTVILDFKVNGYCSNKAQTPMGGYVRLRSGGRTNHGHHKECQPMMWRGMMINVSRHLESFNKDWARQLSIYAWLTGEPVGAEFIVAIDQLSCSPNPGGLPIIKVADHRTRISNAFQWATFNRAAEIWEIVHSGHLFRDVSEEASRERCLALDRQSSELSGQGASHDQWFAGATRVKTF